MGRLIRRMGSTWRFGRRRRAGYESDRFRLMLYDRTGGGTSQQGSDGSGSDGAVNDGANDPAGDPAGQRPAGKRFAKPRPQSDGALLALMPTFDRWVDEFVWGPDSQDDLSAGGDAGEEPIYQFEDDRSRRSSAITKVGEYGELAICSRWAAGWWRRE